MTVGQNTYDSTYYAANGRQAEVQTSVGTILSDDFGGSALDTNRWDVWPGGITGIGSGTNVGMTYSVANSGLAVQMGTTAGDELWFLSSTTFVGSEDLMFTLTKSQALVANSIFVGLVEVDTSGTPIANASMPTDFQNRGGVECGGSITTTAYHAEAVADNSPTVASGAIGVASVWTTAQEVYVEYHAEDIIVTTGLLDNISAKVATGSRVSSQCPNDNRAYKLLLRFRNTAGPATSTTVTLGRVLLVDGYENRVEVTSGRGDNNAQKAIAVNIVGSPTGLAVNNTPLATVGANTTHHLISAASTNSTLVKATALTINSLVVSNNGAAAAYFKLYSKNTAPTVGTDTPVLTMLIPVNGTVIYDCGPCGWRLAAGTGYGITGGMAIADTAAVALNQVSVHMVYT